MPIYTLCFVNVNLLHEFPDDLSIQFSNVGVSSYQVEEVICIQGFFFFRRKQMLQFLDASLQLFLLGFVVGTHLRKTLIGNFTFHVILVKPLNNLIQFGDTLHGLFQFSLSFTLTLVEFRK